MKQSINNVIRYTFASLFMGLCLLATGTASAASAKEINIKIDSTLKQFKQKVGGANEFLNKAEVIKAGIGIGGEYGEGALRIKGKTVNYYSTAAASIGFQLGAQVKSVIIVFLSKTALNKFRSSNGWEVGVDGSVALIELGAGKSIDSTSYKKPIVGFIFGNKGLMYNLTLEGSKFTKIVR